MNFYINKNTFNIRRRLRALGYTIFDNSEFFPKDFFLIVEVFHNHVSFSKEKPKDILGWTDCSNDEIKFLKLAEEYSKKTL